MKNQKGITLIALAITIIVMLILAAVVIRASIGENGIFNKAKQARDAYNESAEAEDEGLKNLDKEMDEKLKKAGVEVVEGDE